MDPHTIHSLQNERYLGALLRGSFINDYLTHTFRCRHAGGEVCDYGAAAQAAGLSELGFSDHAPWPADTAANLFDDRISRGSSASGLWKDFRRRFVY